jgi:hypothetical protein
MKKIIISTVTIVILAIILWSCESITNSENNSGLNNNTLNKKNVKEIYTYKLEPCYTKLPDAHGVIKIQMKDEGQYAFDLRAVKLEPGMEYKLKAREAVPIEIVCPYILTDELIGEADKKGTLEMSGVLNLRTGYTIYVFTSSDILTSGCFQKILEIEKILF